MITIYEKLTCMKPQKEELFSANTFSKWDTLLFLQILILTRKFH